MPINRNSRRVAKSRRIRQLLRNLPAGVTFVGDPCDLIEEHVLLASKAREAQIKREGRATFSLKPFIDYRLPNTMDGNCFLICEFVIHI